MNKLVLKAQRLITAIYLVTDFVHENETLRSRMRKCALELLHGLLRREREKALCCAQELSTLTRVGQATGLISSMNASILESELEHFGAAIKEEAGSSVTKDFFESFDEEPRSRKGHFIGQNVLERNRLVTQRTHDKKPFLPSGNRSSNAERRGYIMDILKKKTPLTVKDVSLVVKGCSEKTLQRELMAMVHEGLLRKEGERRWSRYSLLSPQSPSAQIS